MSDTIVIRYNEFGHPDEFTVHLPGDDLPDDIARQVESKLGPGYLVGRRGNRLDVVSRHFTSTESGTHQLPTIQHAVVDVASDLYETVPTIETDLRTAPPRHKPF